jgi:microcompartment protein CcmK/EutM
MRLGRIVGTVVSTIKASGLNAYKLLLVTNIDAKRPEDVEEKADIYVAVDLTGAGEGDVVLVSTGSAARIGEGNSAIPTDAAVIAIIDTIQAGSTTTYRKR